MQYFTDLKHRMPILDVPPLIGQGTGDQAETQLAHHRVLVGMHRNLGLGYDVAHHVKELVKGCHTRPLGCSYVVCLGPPCKVKIDSNRCSLSDISVVISRT